MNFLEKIYEKLLNIWKYITFKKIINKLLIDFQKIFKISYVYGYPYIAKIEPTNLCTGSCVLCPVGQGFFSKPKGFLTFKNYKKVIDQLKSYLLAVDLSNWGEPFLNKKIYDMIEYAHKNKIWTYLSSNFSTFNPKTDARKLILSGIDCIGISLHGLSQTTYNQYQKNKHYNFKEIINKIKYLILEKKKLHSKTPKIILGFVVTKFNEYELTFVKEFSKKLGVDYDLKSLSLNLRFLGLTNNLQDMGCSLNLLNKLFIDRLSWLPKNRRYIRKPYLAILKQKRLKGKMVECGWPWTSTVISWAGDVTVCCGIFNKKYVLGNIFNKSFKDIWNNELYVACRDSFKNSNTIEVCCKDCFGTRI